MNFFKSFLASVLGTVVALIFIGLLMTMSLAGLATVVATEDAVPVEIKENSILELDLDIQMFDNVGATQELEEALGLGEALKFYDVVSAIRKAAAEDNIKGINLEMPISNYGLVPSTNHSKSIERI